jgi:hypothetical protein
MSGSGAGWWAAGIEAVVQRLQGVAADGYDDRFLLDRQHGRTNRLRAHELIAEAPALTPFLHGGGADAVAPGQGSYAFLTSLDCATNWIERGALPRRSCPITLPSQNGGLSYHHTAGPNI